jgi:hypothetical protein
MRKASVLVAALLLTAAAPSPARAELSLSLRLAGGGTRLALADANAVLADWRTFRIKEVESFKSWALLEDKVGALHFGYDFDAEAIFGFGRYFALGIAAGVLNASLSESDVRLTINRPAGTFNYAHTMTVNAFPVLVSAYAFLPLGAKFAVYAKAGGGLVWGKFTEREANKPVASEKYFYPVSQSASAKGTIRAAGLGVRFAADEKLSFLAEVAARAGALTDFEGQSKEGYRGALYSFEQYDPRLKFWQRRFEIMEHSPQSPDFRNQGKARIDFGGVSVKLGVALAF